MQPEQTESSFREFLTQRKLALGGLSPAQGLDAMLDFFAAVRADGCNPDLDEDMLLFQWGTYDWGTGRHFELNFTRQVLVATEDEDERDIWQLSLTLRFPPEAAFERFGRGDRWCSTPAEIPAFRTFVEELPAFKELSGLPALSPSLEFFCAE